MLPVLARPRARGFTLIEILVVMAIIGIVVALAAVRFGMSDIDTLQRESERLALLLEAARDEAISGGQTIGFAADGQGYRFWQQDARANWQALDKNEALRPRPLPDALRLEDLRVNLAPLPADAKLVFSPTGVNAPFSLLLRAGEHSRLLSADPLGRMVVSDPAAKPAVPAQARP